MLVESLVCSPTPSYPYHIAAKRYSARYDSDTTKQRYSESDNELTLIFLHSTSFHKEIWEPTIEGLLQGQDRWRTRIREVYAIDCPNHGVAAVLNDGLLRDFAGMMKSRIPRTGRGTDGIFLDRGAFLVAGTKLFAECAMQFLLSGPTLNTPVDFSKRNLVGIGHSAGGVAV